MEVHAHSHTERKKWFHYLWEFSMLFLAVFCGFLAENFREHQVEHQREKKYISSLTVDLKNDTAELKSVLEFDKLKIRGMDTLTRLLNKQLLNEDDEKKLYQLNGKYASNIYTMIFNDGTMRQLLNSGNMRLINQAVSDSIMNYYGQLKDDVLGQEQIYGEMSKRLVFATEDIFDRSISSLKIKDDYTFYWEKGDAAIKLLTRDKQVLKRYSQVIITAQRMLSNYMDMLLLIQEVATRLLPYLQKEYDLK